MKLKLSGSLFYSVVFFKINKGHWKLMAGTFGTNMLFLAIGNLSYRQG